MTLELDTAAAAIVRDHAFVPRGEWFEVCGYNYSGFVCGLAEAAHASTTLNHEPKTVIDHEGTT
jgi:hypothetical protein